MRLEGCAGAWRARFAAFGGPCEILVDGGGEDEARALAHAAAGVARRIECKYSRYLPTSVLSTVNARAGVPTLVDDETARLIEFAALMYQLSDGLFDITSGVLRRAWTFDGRARVPAQDEIDALLPLVGWGRVAWKRPEILLLPGMQLDFGGIGKEYAVDQAVEAVAAISRRAVLINFGGDLAATGARRDGAAWRVGIEAIRRDPGETAAVIELVDGAVATSGDTHRYVEANGTRLPHILDPRTGRPMENAPHSITVTAPTCTHAGMLSTLAMLRGADAEQFLRAEGARFWLQRD